MTKDENGDNHNHTHPPSDLALRVRSLESLLVEKGLVEEATIDALIDAYETQIGPRNGAKVVAHAWSDPEFKQRLLRDATAAIASMTSAILSTAILTGIFSMFQNGRRQSKEPCRSSVSCAALSAYVRKSSTDQIVIT